VRGWRFATADVRRGLLRAGSADVVVRDPTSRASTWRGSSPRVRCSTSSWRSPACGARCRRHRAALAAALASRLADGPAPGRRPGGAVRAARRSSNSWTTWIPPSTLDGTLDEARRLAGIIPLARSRCRSRSGRCSFARVRRHTKPAPSSTSSGCGDSVEEAPSTSPSRRTPPATRDLAEWRWRASAGPRPPRCRRLHRRRCRWRTSAILVTARPGCDSAPQW
jgi:hypothetical protein